MVQSEQHVIYRLKAGGGGRVDKGLIQTPWLYPGITGKGQ